MVPEARRAERKIALDATDGAKAALTIEGSAPVYGGPAGARGEGRKARTPTTGEGRRCRERRGGGVVGRPARPT